VAGRVVATNQGRGWRAWITRTAEGFDVLDLAVDDVASVLQSPRGWWFEIGGTDRALDALAWAVEESTPSRKRPACIAWTPTAAPLVRALRPSRLVFDSLDNWLIHPILRRQRDRAMPAYRELLGRADLVTVSAPASAAALAPFRLAVEVLPNGVDVERFSGNVSTLLAGLPSGPVVGYAGKLALRIDAELCLAVARALPSVQFVFLGPVLDRTVVRIGGAPNIHLVGDRHPDVLPDYIRRFDVAWIPHRVGEGETGGDPIKLYEYWAANLQVVTTAIDGHERWTDRAFVIRNAAEAASTLEGILEGHLRKPVWVEPERHWSAIADRLADALVGDPAATASSEPGASAAVHHRRNGPEHDL
jgi:glycosyltransferase involved in cell wall biosynthesis